MCKARSSQGRWAIDIYSGLRAFSLLVPPLTCASRLKLFLGRVHPERIIIGFMPLVRSCLKLTCADRLKLFLADCKSRFLYKMLKSSIRGLWMLLRTHVSHVSSFSCTLRTKRMYITILSMLSIGHQSKIELACLAVR